jgi:hypothetical protein
MEGYCSTGQSPQRAVVPMEEEEEDNEGISISKRVVGYKYEFLFKLCPPSTEAAKVRPGRCRLLCD